MDLPAEPRLRWILSRTAAILELGVKPASGLVLPIEDFFPDRFDGTPRSVAALMTRIQGHAGRSDLKIVLALLTPEGEAQAVSCASGACGSSGAIDTRLDRVARRDDGSYGVALGTGEARNPVVLTTTLVRAVASIFLIETHAFAAAPEAEREPLTDLAAVLLGFGVLVANGSYIYMKGCGGVRVHSATALPVDEAALALGIFCRLHGLSARTARKHLDATPAAYFDKACAWAQSNAATMKTLGTKPAAVRAGEYALEPARSWLARALGLGRKGRERNPGDEPAEVERHPRRSA
jgi:hypothetical protein